MIPIADAVAVVGDRILAVGSKEALISEIGDQPYTLDETFKNYIIVPGLIAQHDHPFLSSLCMTSEIIAIEEWVLPAGTVPAAKDRTEYLSRLAEAEAKMEDSDTLLLTWGFHHYFHGKLAKPLQEAQNAVLGDATSPFRYYYIPDGKTLVAAHPEEQVIAETEKLMDWGEGMTAFLPKQVKLFADGAIYSQAMQVKDGYLDGHKGEWMARIRQVNTLYHQQLAARGRTVGSLFRASSHEMASGPRRSLACRPGCACGSTILHALSSSAFLDHRFPE